MTNDAKRAAEQAWESNRKAEKEGRRERFGVALVNGKPTVIRLPCPPDDERVDSVTRGKR